MLMLKLAFYKGTGTWLDHLIRWWTRSDYSHVEFLIEGDGDKPLILLSSSARDGGVRIKAIAHSQFKSQNWHCIDITDRLSDNDLIRYYERNHGAKYDFAGILFSQIMPFKLHRKARYFCSEFCAESLGLTSPHHYSPQKLYEAIHGHP